MKGTRYTNRKWRLPPSRSIEDEFADFEPDPVKVELYRILPQSRKCFLANLAWYERSLADIKARFGGGVYQIVVRYRGRIKITPVFEIEGEPIDVRR